jgi:hypothetical protein
MYELYYILDDLKNNIADIPGELLFNALPNYKQHSAITSGGWRIYANNNEFMRFSAIKTFDDIETTYFVHLIRSADGVVIADAGAKPAVIGSDGLIMFMHRPQNMPHILYSSEYCDIEVYLVEV